MQRYYKTTHTDRCEHRVITGLGWRALKQDGDITTWPFLHKHHWGRHYSTSGSMYYIILLPGLCITLFYFRVLQLFRGGTPLKNSHEQGRGVFADYDLRSAEVLISSCRLAALSCTYH